MSQPTGSSPTPDLPTPNGCHESHCTSECYLPQFQEAIDTFIELYQPYVYVPDQAHLDKCFEAFDNY